MKRTAILGHGFTGGELARSFDWPAGSCVASRRTDAACRLPIVPFDWDDATTWPNLPDTLDALIITIPPVHRDDIAAERDRMTRWADWMTAERPACRRVVYVSTTGVYPQRPGLYDESCTEEPDTDSGRIRVMTERLLAARFDARIVRAGGIYGPGRNAVTRILEAKPPAPPARPGGSEASRASGASGGRPVHRIHVHDLAAICVAMLADDAPAVVNAVDDEPATTAALLRWAADQPWCPQPDLVRAAAALDTAAAPEPPEPPESPHAPAPAPAAFAAAPATPASSAGDEPRRVIDASRRRLAWPALLRYPTFRDGLTACFT